MCLQLTQFRASVETFEQVLHCLRDLLLRQNCCPLKFCLLLHHAKQCLDSLDTHVRAELKTFTRRIPSVLLVSIFQFLSPLERRQTLPVCKLWHAMPPRIKTHFERLKPLCEIHPIQSDLLVLCKTCNKVVCNPCSLEEHKSHFFVSLEEGIKIVKSSLKETIDTASTREALINAEMEHLQQLVPKAKETEINLKERKQRKAQEIEDVPVIKELLRRARINSLEFVRQGIPYIKIPWFALGELVNARVGQLVDVRDINHTWYESTIMSIRGGKVWVHYNRWPSICDEWIDLKAGRIAPFRTLSHC